MLLNRMNRAWLRYLFFIGIYSFYSQAAFATCSGLGCSCIAGPNTAVAFGHYNPISATATTATGNVQVTCAALGIFTVAYVISMNAGNSGSFRARFMKLGSMHLNYNLYTTAAHTTIWGNGTGGTGRVRDSYTAEVIGPVRKNYTVFGLLPALQAVGVGTYSDTVIVTVTY
jgi:spore coat protein U domain-containing protein, fimbrial subunit CupE1/2/3/6